MKTLIKKLIPQTLLEERGRTYKTDTEAIAGLKDKFKGERCFVLGNGPSLNQTGLNKLKNEYSFAVNSIYYKTDEMGYKPNFFVVEDRHVIRDNVERISNYKCDYRFFPREYQKFVPKGDPNTYYFTMNRGFYVETSKHYEVPRFSFDCSKRIYCGQSVTMLCLQLAFFLGFTKVFLIGMDFDYKVPSSVISDGKGLLESTEDDVNHFHPDYFGKGKKWHDPKLHNVLKSYINCKKEYEAHGRKIYNATAGGKLEVFERVDFKDLFSA